MTIIYCVLLEYDIAALPACIAGLSDPTLSTCDEYGNNDVVNAQNYTCNAGYYVTSAPVYCQCMDALDALVILKALKSSRRREGQCTALLCA